MTNMDVKPTTAVTSVTLESGSVLTADTVRNYLVSGGGNVTDQEVVMFLELCKAQKLNPFVKDAYLIKYGNQAAQIVTGKDVFIKRAYENPNFDGMRAGVVILKKDGSLEYREGSLKLANETLVGGWCEVYLKDKRCPAKAVVSFDEYAGRKANGQLNSMWANKGATMIRKVAQSQVLREAFPSEFRGCYQKEELGAEYDAPTTEIPPEVIERKETVVEHPTEEVEIIDAEIVEDKVISKEQKKQLLLVAEEHGLYSSKVKQNLSKLEEYLDLYGFKLKDIKESEYEDVIEAIKENQVNDTEVEVVEQTATKEEKVTMAREIIENYNKENGILN